MGNIIRKKKIKTISTKNLDNILSGNIHITDNDNINNKYFIELDNVNKSIYQSNTIDDSNDNNDNNNNILKNNDDNNKIVNNTDKLIIQSKLLSLPNSLLSEKNNIQPKTLSLINIPFINDDTKLIRQSQILSTYPHNNIDDIDDIDNTDFNNNLIEQDNTIYNIKTLDNAILGNNEMNLPSEFKETTTNVIIIFIDFINSTQIIQDFDVIKLINITKQFNKELINLIEYYKYIYIYEIIGDAYILTINFPHINSITNPASLAIKFCMNLINNTCSYIKIKTGITFDKLYYGIINNHIRLFGKGIQLASRLENNSTENNIYCSKDLYNQLLLENQYNLFITKKILNLKGIGNYECYILNIKNNNIID